MQTTITTQQAVQSHQAVSNFSRCLAEISHTSMPDVVLQDGWFDLKAPVASLVQGKPMLADLARDWCFLD